MSNFGHNFPQKRCNFLQKSNQTATKRHTQPKDIHSLWTTFWFALSLFVSAFSGSNFSFAREKSLCRSVCLSVSSDLCPRKVALAMSSDSVLCSFVCELCSSEPLTASERSEHQKERERERDSFARAQIFPLKLTGSNNERQISSPFNGLSQAQPNPRQRFDNGPLIEPGSRAKRAIDL